MTGSYSVDETRVWGWSKGKDDPSRTYVNVYIGDMFLKRLRSNQLWPEPPQEFNDGLPRGFAFAFSRSLRKLIPKGQKVRIVDQDGYELLHLGGNFDVGLAEDGGQELKKRFESGWCVDKWGGLVLPFNADPGRDQRFMNFFVEKSELLSRELGYKFFLSYGTLLGAVRDNRLIQFDDDVDCSYLSKYAKPEDVAKEFHEIFNSISQIAPSIGVTVGMVDTGQLCVQKDDMKFDIFTSWIDIQRRYNCYFGVSARMGYRWFRLKKISFMGHKVRIPSYSKKILEWTYGPSWNVPDPHFSWIPPKETNEVMEELRIHGQKFK